MKCLIIIIMNCQLFIIELRCECFFFKRDVLNAFIIEMHYKLFWIYRVSQNYARNLSTIMIDGQKPAINSTTWHTFHGVCLNWNYIFYSLLEFFYFLLYTRFFIVPHSQNSQGVISEQTGGYANDPSGRIQRSKWRCAPSLWK